MNVPLASRRGSTGALARRVSDYETVREFFASTTVVLIVDIMFLFIFLIIITILAGWLVMVPIVGIVLMAVAGMTLQKAMAPASVDAQADASLQHSVLVEFDRRPGNVQGGGRRGPHARPLAALCRDERVDPGAAARPHRDQHQPGKPLPAIDERRADHRRLLPVQRRQHLDGRDHRDRDAVGPRHGAGRAIRLPDDPGAPRLHGHGIAAVDRRASGRALHRTQPAAFNRAGRDPLRPSLFPLSGDQQGCTVGPVADDQTGRAYRDHRPRRLGQVDTGPHHLRSL